MGVELHKTKAKHVGVLALGKICTLNCVHDLLYNPELSAQEFQVRQNGAHMKRKVRQPGKRSRSSLDKITHSHYDGFCSLFDTRDQLDLFAVKFYFRFPDLLDFLLAEQQKLLFLYIGWVFINVYPLNFLTGKGTIKLYEIETAV